MSEARRAPSAATRLNWRGVTLDARTATALEWAEKKAGAGVRIIPVQGSYRPASALSGSTHTKGGAVDIRSRTLTVAQRVRLVHALKDAGFAAWYRRPGSGFAPHIHAILAGGGADGTAPVGGVSLSSGAAWQVRAFDKGRDGLTRNQGDPTYRPSRRRWSWRLNGPVRR